MQDKIEKILLKLRDQLITKRECLKGVTPPTDAAHDKIVYRIGKLNEEIDTVNEALSTYKENTGNR